MHDVIVLGAGASGLAAAAELTEAGLDVCIVEARSRAGGRIATIRPSRTSLPVELGAEFVHGEASPTRAIANEARMPLVDVLGTHWLSRGDVMEPVHDFRAKLASAMSAAARHVRTGHDKSFTDALRGARVSTEARQLGHSFVEGFNAAPADRISARALTKGANGAERMARTIQGYDALTEWLTGKLRPECLRLSTCATRVLWRKDDVRVDCRSRTGSDLPPLVARRLIVTLPLGVLAVSLGDPANALEVGAVHFEPALASKAKAIHKLAMGNVVRLTLRFRRAFWREPSNVRTHHRRELSRLSFVHAPGAAVMTWWTPYPIEAPLLTGWSGGPPADALLPLGEPKILDRALESLSHAFGASRRVIDDGVDGSFFHDWAADPFARGAYSYPLVGGANAASLLAAPIEHTLFFAGEATAPSPDNGTVDGAIASGQRAAREVLITLDRPARRASTKGGRGRS